MRDVDVEERFPLDQHLRSEAVDVNAVVHRETFDRRRRELIEQREEERTGLLVLPAVSEEHGNINGMCEGRRIDAAHEIVRIVRSLLRLGNGVDLLSVEELVVRANRIAFVDLTLFPALTIRCGLVDDVGDPIEREAVVENAARARRRIRSANDRQRRDRDEARRMLLCDEELRDTGIGEAGHADAMSDRPNSALQPSR